ncbi:OmpA family protein [Aquabacter spiritensis]|uniref:Outer membrane protein OmpA-like peptidoglycan-associated protein n=1 Tax=Aquabacter spiritensis TaxID=933073 RepID=A0A4V2UY99_9HYPH|nr:OmpA family protein [Aquabacter spiritensis]TCT06548.1 outer membrane protein OmpA-like peptidoglycan-associated protein [Aquabacter spiritensis]
MTSPLIRFALAASLALSAAPALAQTSLSDSQILQGLQGLTDSAPTMTAQQMRNMVQQHMSQYPGEALTRPSLALNLDKLPQINVQIQFRLNSSIIEPSSYGTLGSIADAMHNPVLHGYKFVVTGNTDVTGPRDFNLKLSQARADAVVNALVTVFNVNASRLEAVGLGEEVLLDPKKPTDPINRRVQIFTIGRMGPPPQPIR